MGVRKKRLIQVAPLRRVLTLKALLISMLVVCVVAEVWLRIRYRHDREQRERLVHVRSDSPRLVYEHGPNAEARFPGNPIVLRTNSAGCPQTTKKPPESSGGF